MTSATSATNWNFILEPILERKVGILLAVRDGRILRGLVTPGSFSLGAHALDLSGLTLAPEGLGGMLDIVLQPDAWYPKDRQSVHCRLRLEVRADGPRLSGAFAGTVGERHTAGTVTGSLAAAEALPEPAQMALTIEQAAPGWSAHLGRGELRVAWDQGAPADFLFRCPFDHAWVARVERIALELAPDRLTGQVQAIVGMQPGSTELGAERVTYALDATVIGAVIAGVCTVTGEDGVPMRRALRGDIAPGQRRLPRTTRARNATTATLTIDARRLRAARSVRPWKTLDFTHERIGQFACMADLDGDGQAEILSTSADRLAITAVLASRLDGTRLWQWGEMGKDRSPGDVPVQAADLDGDGREEVYAVGRGEMVVLDPATGRELRRWPMPEDLPWSDCLVIVNLRGLDQPRDLLVKDRHGMCYAFTGMGERLWRWQDPAGRQIAHHPLAWDLDGDGRDEVLVGWSLLGPDGRQRWDLRSELSDLRRGHLDAASVVRAGTSPEETLLAVSFDEANGLALVDGAGRTRWEVCGSHFHTLCSGLMWPGEEEAQIVCTLARLKQWCWRAWMMSLDGRLLAEYLGLDLPAFMDWDGDGVLEIVGGRGIVLRATGEPVANLLDADGRDLPANSPELVGHAPCLADVDGDGRCELLLRDQRTLRIYRSPDLAPLPGKHRPGTWNFTAYGCPVAPPAKGRG